MMLAGSPVRKCQPLAVPALIEPLNVASAVLPVTWPMLKVTALARLGAMVDPFGPVAVLTLFLLPAAWLCFHRAEFRFAENI